MSDPQTLTQLLSPYFPLVTPAAMIGAAFWLGKFIATAQTELEAAKSQLGTMMSNHLPHLQEAMDKLVTLGERQDRRMDAWMTAEAAQAKRQKDS